jgi:carboxymethylenebutenolidase
MSGQQIKISAAAGGAFDAYLALPSGQPAPAPGIVMLHEIFGVTDWVRETADLFSGHGFCVAAPDMFWRLEPNFAADFNDLAQRAQGIRYKEAIDHDAAMEDIAAVMTRLKSMPECNGKIGVTGFCTGGTLAYLAAARLDVDAAAPYYGTQIHEFLDDGKNIACPAIFHMGDSDEHVPGDIADLVAAALAGLPDIAIHRYDTGHAFAHAGRLDHYSGAASRAAHARTFGLFDRLR